MKSGNSTARNGNEGKREQLASEHRARSINELRELGHLQRRQHDQNTGTKRQHHTNLHKRRQVITWCEQQPHGQHRRKKSVAHDPQRERRRIEIEIRRNRWLASDPLACVQRKPQHDETDCRGLQHFMLTEPAQIRAHEERDRNRECNGDHTPRTALERVHHNQAKHRNQDDHDAENGNQRG